MTLGVDREDLVDTKMQLFTFPSQYTSGAVRAGVKRRGVKGVLEAYRCIHFEGLRITPQASFENKAFIWQVQEVTLDKLREAVETFEQRLDPLEEMDGYTMQEDDKLQALLKRCPLPLREVEDAR